MNLGFNFDDSYDQATSKTFPVHDPFNDTGVSDSTISKDELLHLLALCEQDLERKDKQIEKLNVRQLLFFF